MAKTSRRGHLQLCIEVKLPGEQTSLAAHRKTIEICQRLAALIQEHEVAATWAIDDSLVETVSGSLGITSSYGVLTATHDALVQHIEKASVPRDVQPAILVSRVEPTLLQLAQLAALGTRAIGLPASSNRRTTRVQARHGLCIVRTTGRLPGYGQLLGRWDAAYQAKHLMHRAWNRKSTETLTLCTDELSHRSPWLQLVDQTLNLAARLRSAGRIVCDTLLDTHERMCATGGTRGAQSILRAA